MNAYAQQDRAYIGQQGAVSLNGSANMPLVRVTVSTLVTDFDPVLKRAADYAYRLQNIRDRVVGAAPSAGEKAGTDALANGLMDAVRNRRMTLVEILDRMEIAITTLDESI